MLPRGYDLFAIIAKGASGTLFLIIWFLVFRRRESPRLELTYEDLGAERYPRREVRFSSCGRSLAGFLYRAASPRGVVAVVHGFRGCAESHLAEAARFIDAGWDVFAFDATGTRKSEGRSLRGLQQMRLDLAAAVAFLRSDPETAGLPLLLYGHSMGAWAAAAVLGRTGAAGAVCVAGFDAPLDTVRFFMRRFGGAPALLGFPLVRLLGRLTFGRESNVSALRAVNATDKPVLIVHGSADEVVPDDISLFARADELTNPNARALLVADEYRGTHSAAWLTREAARCLLARRAELSRLRSEKKRCEFLLRLDRRPLARLDEGFMREVLRFFSFAAERSKLSPEGGDKKRPARAG